MQTQRGATKIKVVMVMRWITTRLLWRGLVVFVL
jgi:hypothetical protein